MFQLLCIQIYWRWVRCSEFSNRYLGKASTKPSSDLEGERPLQIWSNVLLHKLTVLDILSVANIFSREWRGPSILNYVCLFSAQRNMILLPSNVFWPKLKLRMWESSDLTLGTWVRCLFTCSTASSGADRYSAFHHVGYLGKTKMGLDSHVKVGNWTEPFIKTVESWGTIHPATYNHQLWDEIISAGVPLAVLLQLSICYQWELRVELRCRLLQKPISGDLNITLSPLLLLLWHQTEANWFKSYWFLATSVEEGQHSLPLPWPVKEPIISVTKSAEHMPNFSLPE